MTRQDNGYNDIFATHLPGHKSSNEHPAGGSPARHSHTPALSCRPNTVFSVNKNTALCMHLRRPSCLDRSQPGRGHDKQTSLAPAEDCSQHPDSMTVYTSTSAEGGGDTGGPLIFSLTNTPHTPSNIQVSMLTINIKSRWNSKILK